MPISRDFIQATAAIVINCLEVEELGETQNGQNGQNGTAHDEPWTSEAAGVPRVCPEMPKKCV